VRSRGGGVGQSSHGTTGRSLSTLDRDACSALTTSAQAGWIVVSRYLGESLAGWPVHVGVISMSGRPKWRCCRLMNRYAICGHGVHLERCLTSVADRNRAPSCCLNAENASPAMVSSGGQQLLDLNARGVGRCAGIQQVAVDGVRRLRGSEAEESSDSLAYRLLRKPGDSPLVPVAHDLHAACRGRSIDGWRSVQCWPG